ncbi:IQ-domain [Orobanche minor]
MGKTGRWIRNFLIGKKENKEREKEKENNGCEHPTMTTITTPQTTTTNEKRRWSFRRSSAAAAGRQELGSSDIATAAATVGHHVGSGSKKHGSPEAAVTRPTAVSGEFYRASAVEEAAAVKIQSVFRAYLARKALNALKGLVKLQALVRGHLVRKQATATLRCMQALISVQARALAQRMRMAEEIKHIDQRPLLVYNNHRKSTQDYRFRNSNQDFDKCAEESIKIVEMDLGDYGHVTRARNSYSNHTRPDGTTEYKISGHRTSNKQENLQISPSPPYALTDISPRTCSNHFEECSLGTVQSSPKCYSAMSKPDPSRIPFPYPRSDYAESLYNEYPFHPNYMANTESSRAKARSHSAPKQRPIETFDRPPSRRKPPIEGRNVPRAVRMERSSSHVGSGAQNYQYPWCVNLDRSAVSLKDSECGSTSTVLTNANYCRSLVGFEVQGGARY